MAENDTVSIRPLHVQKEGAEAGSAREAAKYLEPNFAEIDAQHAAIATDETESPLDEVMHSVRPGYTPHR
jgi:hypothetical protein